MEPHETAGNSQGLYEVDWMTYSDPDYFGDDEPNPRGYNDAFEALREAFGNQESLNQMQKSMDETALSTPIEDLLEAVEASRKLLCTYRGPTCDCKFGATGIGEQTGCPELRRVYGYLKALQRQPTVIIP